MKITCPCVGSGVAHPNTQTKNGISEKSFPFAPFFSRYFHITRHDSCILLRGNITSHDEETLSVCMIPSPRINRRGERKSCMPIFANDSRTSRIASLTLHITFVDKTGSHKNVRYIGFLAIQYFEYYSVGITRCRCFELLNRHYVRMPR